MKKKFLIIPLSLIAALAVLAAHFMLNKVPYKLENSPVIAAEANVAEFFEQNFDETNIETAIGNFKFKEEGINTAVLYLNDYSNVFLNKDVYKDSLKSIIDICTKDEIQIYFALDCAILTNEELLECAKVINKRYPVAAIVLENYNGADEELVTIQNTLSKPDKDIELFADVSATYFAEYKEDLIFDGFICKDVKTAEYISLKNAEPSKTFVLHHSTNSVFSDIAYLINYQQLDGAVVYMCDSEKEYTIPSYKLFEPLQEKPEFNFAVNNKFAVTYPSEDITTWYKGIFITGTGAKENKVYIDGVAYPAASDGTFGVYVELKAGANPMVISNGEENFMVNVTRKVSSGSGGTSSKIYWDDSPRLEKGRIIKTFDPLTSVLSNPEDSSSIIGGLPAGTELIVQKSKQIKSGGKYSWAYQLSNGGYILPAKVTVENSVSEDYESPNKPKKGERAYAPIKLKGAGVYAAPTIDGVDVLPGENCETFTVKNSSKPAVFSEFTDNYLELLFLDAKTTDFQLPESSLCNQLSIRTVEAGVALRFEYKPGSIWGFDVKTGDQQTEIWLKSRPALKYGTDKPLEGITIMLDPGHGGTDGGALGIAYPNGPIEKELNLAVGLITRELLESYGATVIMTREDDTFPTLEDRRSAMSTHKPDLFISMHHNSMDYSYDSTKAKGSECYYFTWQSAILAKHMCQEVSQATARNDRGAKNSYYYVTRSDVCPAVLMEYGFLINAQEYSEIYTDEMLFKSAQGTLMAVLKTFSK